MEALNISEVAKALGCSRPTVYRLIARGLLTVKRDPLFTGRPVAIPKSEVTALVDRRKVAA